MIPVLYDCSSGGGGGGGGLMGAAEGTPFSVNNVEEAARGVTLCAAERAGLMAFTDHARY